LKVSKLNTVWLEFRKYFATGITIYMAVTSENILVPLVAMILFTMALQLYGTYKKLSLLSYLVTNFLFILIISCTGSMESIPLSGRLGICQVTF